jgi:hypothetical protein
MISKALISSTTLLLGLRVSVDVLRIAQGRARRRRAHFPALVRDGGSFGGFGVF